MKPNQQTRRVMVGNVPMGGGAPCVVQSMLNAPADDAAANLAQIEALAQTGCEVVRMAIPRRAWTPSRRCVRPLSRGGGHSLRCTAPSRRPVAARQLRIN
ncbi:MAG: flavodoxin-dependent (E)-4-hydroxy-3-methylbut-2-enyl-diphosphate synthase [Eggerthellaceae bacterium]